jgi:acyl-coenzyme A thioesterase PaaI-like protein
MQTRSGPFWDGVQGRVVHRDGDLANLEASLADADGKVIATATATARVIALSDAPAAA